MGRGIGSVYATPLRTHDTLTGALNPFDADLLIVRALADVATFTLPQQRNAEHAAAVDTQL